MKKFLASMLIAVTALSLVADAFARPMGSGRSFGRQSSSVSRMGSPAPAPAPYAPSYQPSYQRPAQAPYAPSQMPIQRPSPWRGILGGALVGLGLGALASHFGMGGVAGGFFSSLLMLILLVLAVTFIARMFRRRDTPANPNFTGFNRDPMPANATPEIGSGLNGGYQGAQQGGFQPSFPNTTAQTHTPWGVPAGFDTEGFLRHAKASFIRMQAAWDHGDLADLREFTAPEVYAELQLQIQERGNQKDYTEVVSIDAQLLGIETTERDYLASVQFNGMIRNAPGAPAEPYVEVWNLSKPLNGNGGWVLAGIQQVH
ncbi:MAG TPA: TIM44-like domain-containing protein [Telluria sp.]